MPLWGATSGQGLVVSYVSYIRNAKAVLTVSQCAGNLDVFRISIFVFRIGSTGRLLLRTINFEITETIPRLSFLGRPAPDLPGRLGK